MLPAPKVKAKYCQIDLGPQHLPKILEYFSMRVASRWVVLPNLIWGLLSAGVARPGPAGLSSRSSTLSTSWTPLLPAGYLGPHHLPNIM